MDTPPASGSSDPPKKSTSPRPEPRQRFPRRLRVTERVDFEQALRHGLRLRDDRLLVWARLNGLDHPRLGLVVGRKHGKAVYRNRLKRLIREGFRLNQDSLPPGVDLICAPVPKAEITLEGVKNSFHRLRKRLLSRLEQVGFDIRTPRQNNH